MLDVEFQAPKPSGSEEDFFYIHNVYFSIYFYRSNP